MINNLIQLNDIFTDKGKVTREVKNLLWPTEVWVIEQWGNLDPEEAWFHDWIEWSFPYTLPNHRTMQSITTKVCNIVSSYRYNKQVMESLRISDTVRQWNECAAAEYNIALSLLGYTENQYLYINETAAIVKSLIFFQK